MKNFFIFSQETAFTLYVLVVGYLASGWLVGSFDLIDGDPIMTPAENMTFAILWMIRFFGVGLFCYILVTFLFPEENAATVPRHKIIVTGSIFLAILVIFISRFYRFGLLELLVLPLFMAYLVGKLFYPSINPREIVFCRKLLRLIPFIVLFQLICIYVTYIALSVFWQGFALPVYLNADDLMLGE